jgi:hypothetical protein
LQYKIIDPDKANPVERQGRKATGLRNLKMAELPKDEKSREAVRPLFLNLPRNLPLVNRKRNGVHAPLITSKAEKENEQ